MLKESPLLPFSSQPIFYRAECITVSGFFSVELPSPPKAGFKTQGNFSGCEDVSHGQLAPEKAAPLIPVPSFFANAILRSVGQIAAFLGNILADIGYLPRESENIYKV